MRKRANKHGRRKDMDRKKTIEGPSIRHAISPIAQSGVLKDSECWGSKERK